MSTPVLTTEPVRGAFRHLPTLDGFRALAILLVLIGHTLTFSLHLPGYWSEIGGGGVALFFVLSGFLITGLLCNKETVHGSIDLGGFYRDRALRIFPAFYLLLVITAGLIALKLVTDVPWYAVGVCALFLRNIAGRGDTLTHLWSLALEQQFYVIWSLALWRVKCRNILPWAIGGAAVITLWRTVAITLHLWHYESGWYYVRTDFRIDSIIIGSCLALVLYRPGDTARREYLRRKLEPVARLAHPLWVFPAFIAWTVGVSLSVACRPFYVTGQMLLGSLMLLNAVLSPPAFWARILTCAVMRRIGLYSYSLYLWQQIFLLQKTPDWGWVRVFPFDLLCACAAGIASYHLIERPFLKWKAALKSQSASPHNT